MPRKSAEELGAAVYRAGVRPPSPPKHLSKDAAAVWRRIVASKPADWFDPGAELILENYCDQAVHIRAVRAELERLRDENDWDAMKPMEKRFSLLSDKMATNASKLRLSVQARVKWEDRKTGERVSPDAANDALIGGMAVWPDDQRAN